MLERWAVDFLADNDDCREINLCCGRYKEVSSRPIGRGRLTCRFAAHDEFIALIKQSDVLLSGPGRTTLHEAYHLGKIPIMLPEQHHNQYHNLKGLEGTGLGDLSLPLGAIVDTRTIPPYRVEGTRAIVDWTREILESETLFRRFDRMLRSRVRHARSLDDVARNQLLHEIKPLTAGRDFVEVVRSITADHSVQSDNAPVR